MKKILKKVSLVLLMCTAGLTVSSCDSDSLSDIISSLIGGLFNQGETYTYSGTSGARAWVKIGTDSQNYTDSTTFSNQQVSLVASTSNNVNVASLTLPSYTWQSIQVTDLSFSNLTLTTTDNVSTLAIDANSTTVNGSFVYNNTTYSAIYAEIKSSKVTQSGIELDMFVQFAPVDSSGNITDQNDIQQLDIVYSGQSTTTSAQ